MEKARSAVLSVEKEISSIKQGLSRLNAVVEEEPNRITLTLLTRPGSTSDTNTNATGSDELVNGVLNVTCSHPVQEQSITIVAQDSDADAEKQVLEWREIELNHAVFTATFTPSNDLSNTNECVDENDEVNVDHKQLVYEQQGEEWQIFSSNSDSGDDDNDSSIVENLLEEFRMDVGTLECSSTPRVVTLKLVIKSLSSEDENKEVEDSTVTEEKSNETFSPDEGEADDSKNVKEEEDDSQNVEKDNKEDKGNEQVLELQFELNFYPGTQLKSDKLYHLLSKASEKKTKAIQELRRAAAAMEQSSQSDAASNSTSAVVKPGFLNNSSSSVSDAKKSKTSLMWERLQNMGSRAAMYWSGTKDYILFIGCVAFAQMYGHALALPPPV